MAHLGKNVQTHRHLQVGVEKAVLRPLTGGLIPDVALGHPHVVGAIETGSAARPGLGEDRDGRDARGGTAGLDLQHAHKLGLGRRIDPPACPAGGVARLDLAIVGQQLPLGIVVGVVGDASVGIEDNACELTGVGRLAATNARYYL